MVELTIMSTFMTKNLSLRNLKPQIKIDRFFKACQEIQL